MAALTGPVGFWCVLLRRCLYLCSTMPRQTAMPRTTAPKQSAISQYWPWNLRQRGGVRQRGSARNQQRRRWRRQCADMSVLWRLCAAQLCPTLPAPSSPLGGGGGSCESHC